MYTFRCRVAGAHVTLYHSPGVDISGPSFKVCVHPADHQSPLALTAPLCDLCVSALVDPCPGPALLRSTLMSNPILTVSSFSPRSRSASHEYPKVRLLDRITPPPTPTPPFQSYWGQFLGHKKNTLNGSSSLPLCFFGFPLLPHSLLSFVHSGLSLNILIHPIQEFICRSTRSLGSQPYR